MSILKNKIDFAVVFTVKNANPNGDPLNDNCPRTTFDGLGIVSSECIKRKIRNVLQCSGEPIFVQSEDNTTDDFDSLAARAADVIKTASNDKELLKKLACENWLDVSLFGQVLAFKSGISVGIRGPVTIHDAFSVLPVDINTMQITKSVNSESSAGKKGSDTMGHRHKVEFGTYVFYGSINPYLAEKTGLTGEQAEKFLDVLPCLFENDESSARPAGSMEVRNVFIWRHNCKAGQYSSGKTHRMISVVPNCDDPKKYEDYTVTNNTPKDLVCEEREGR